MARKISGRSGTKSGHHLLGTGAAKKAGDDIKQTGARRGTQRSKQMDDIMSGLSSGRRKKKK